MVYFDLMLSLCIYRIIRSIARKCALNIYVYLIKMQNILKSSTTAFIIVSKYFKDL